LMISFLHCFCHVIRRIESLLVVPISKVSAQQRAGRAGRTGVVV
jgi:HrpA-like RNA helicase